jgi:hypothetical protein
MDRASAEREATLRALLQTRETELAMLRERRRGRAEF